MKTTLRAPFAFFAVVGLVACEASSAPSSGGAPASTGMLPAPAPSVTGTAPTMMTMPGSTTAPPDGKAWGPAVEISSSTFSNLRGSPQVAIDASGNAVAVWLEELADNTRNAIWSSRYAAGGAWSTPSTIDNPVGSPTAPQLAMTPNGTAVVVFGQSESNQGGAELLVTNRFTGAWGTPTTISTPGLSPRDPFLALAPDGAATLVLEAADAMFPRAWVARATAAGSWDAPAVLANHAEPGWAPAITVAANGDAVMTWTETGGGPSQTSLWASRNRGGVWETPALLSSDTGQVEASILVGADAGGNALALWSQRLGGIGGPYTLRSARLSASTGTWSAPVTVNDGQHEATTARLAVDAAGDAVAVWYEANHGVVASRFLAATATWDSPATVQAQTTGLVAVVEPSVGVDAKGNAVASWVQPIGSPPRPRLFAAQLASSSGTWTAPIDLLADTNATPYASETQLSVNTKGEAILVWHQQTDMPPATGIWARALR